MSRNMIPLPEALEHLKELCANNMRGSVAYDQSLDTVIDLLKEASENEKGEVQDFLKRNSRIFGQKETDKIEKALKEKTGSVSVSS